MIQKLSTDERHLVLIPSGAWLQELTQIDEDNAVLWLRGKEHFLFADGLTDHDRLWDDRADARDQAAKFGFQLLSKKDFEAKLKSIIADVDEILLPFSDGKFLSRIVSTMTAAKRFRRREASLSDLRNLWGAAKLIKSEKEIEALREAGRRSGEAHLGLLKLSWSGKPEAEMARSFDIFLHERGISDRAYQSIVAGGERSLILHGRASERILKTGEMVLIDAAGVWKGLCADITRTWPIGKAFDADQRRLYEIVLNAQKLVIANIRPGTSLGALHALAKAKLKEGLVAAGWMAENRDDLLQAWFPHNTSHWIGKQVHDPCPYFEEDGSEIKLEAGMVLTVEPGLYMSGAEAPAGIRGQGVRIEDDILVTQHGCEILTASAPKELAEIEALRGKFS